MQRWNWFLAADIEGKWITTNGYAEVVIKNSTLDASLRYDPDTIPYHNITATIGEQDTVDALVTSPGREDVVPFNLSGAIFRGTPEDGIETVMILLTDGTTVIGLAHGPRSHESNL